MLRFEYSGLTISIRFVVPEDRHAGLLRGLTSTAPRMPALIAKYTVNIDPSAQRYSS